ncbi:MAG: YggT family protein [Coriobacteriales bacterium]|jgi:YggT family protein|nr:YggT family protein [Coriobacteriales bacterium]
MLSYFLPPILTTFILTLINIYVVLIVVWAIFSWFDHSKGLLNDIYKVLDQIISPFINLFKRFIPPLGGLDLSPLIAVILLQLVAWFLF